MSYDLAIKNLTIADSLPRLEFFASTGTHDLCLRGSTCSQLGFDYTNALAKRLNAAIAPVLKLEAEKLANEARVSMGEPIKAMNGPQQLLDASPGYNYITQDDDGRVDRWRFRPMYSEAQGMWVSDTSNVARAYSLGQYDMLDWGSQRPCDRIISRGDVDD